MSTRRLSTSIDVADRGDGGGGIEVEAAGEHGQTTERDSLVVEQEVVAPVEGGGQGLLAVRMAGPAPGEDGERIAQADGQLGDGEVDDTHGGQLEGEGDAVEAATDLGDGGGSGGIEHEARRRVPRSLDEQLDGLETSQPVGRVVVSRKLERGHPPGDLAGLPERLAARGQDDEIGASRQELRGQGDDGVEDVLAVVEDEQDRPARELVDERGDPRPVALEGQLEGTTDRRRDTVAVRHAGQLHEPHPVRPSGSSPPDHARARRPSGSCPRRRGRSA